MDVYIVIGDSKAGKSRTIMSLTGIRGKGQVKMAYKWCAKCSFALWVEESSLQEQRPVVSPDDFVKEVSKMGGIDAVLIALWPNKRKRVRKWEGAATYIAEFQNAGWHIKPPVLLNCDVDGLDPKIKRKARKFTNHKSEPFNVYMAKVSRHWKWK